MKTIIVHLGPGKRQFQVLVDGEPFTVYSGFDIPSMPEMSWQRGSTERRPQIDFDRFGRARVVRWEGGSLGYWWSPDYWGSETVRIYPETSKEYKQIMKLLARGLL